MKKHVINIRQFSFLLNASYSGWLKKSHDWSLAKHENVSRSFAEGCLCWKPHEDRSDTYVNKGVSLVASAFNRSSVVVGLGEERKVLSWTTIQAL